MPNPSEVRRYKGLLRSVVDQAMLVDIVRYVVVATRYFWFVRVRRRLETFDLKSGQGTPVAAHTISHNLKGLRDFAAARSHFLVRPLSVIESLPVDAKLLSIGPRTEGELFNLAGHGFVLANISALDLISYSPRVQVGDMHRIPHADDAFDAVVLGWVLAYSEDPRAAAAEAVRVTRPGGIIAVGVEYSPRTPEEVYKEVGYHAGSGHHMASCDEILAYFGSSVDHLYVKHDVAPPDRRRVGAMCVIFSVKK